jgi:hypothetical protein
MTMREISGSPKAVSGNWFRRAVMGATFAAVGVVALGAATTPAEAYWYGYGYHPYYAYHPYHYGWYGYGPSFRVGWGWGGYGWRGGWGHHGWYR